MFGPVLGSMFQGFKCCFVLALEGFFALSLASSGLLLGLLLAGLVDG